MTTENVDGQLIGPWDHYNRQLVAHAHPSDWNNPEPQKRYNLVVIGAGTAGLVTAAGAAGLGAKVALVEKHLMGGDCLNVGCVPSKALIHSSIGPPNITTHTLTADRAIHAVLVVPELPMFEPLASETLRVLIGAPTEHSQ